MSAESTPATDAGAASKRAGILILESDEQFREVLKTWFRSEGFAVWTASDGAEAVRIYQTHHAAIGFMLMDADTPGLLGPHLPTMLRGIDPNLRCCIVGGNPGDATGYPFMECGPDFMLGWPLDLALLTAELGRLLTVKTA